jgi:hypothetical protein
VVAALRGPSGVSQAFQRHAGPSGEFTVASGSWSAITLVQLPGSTEAPGTLVVWGGRYQSRRTWWHFRYDHGRAKFGAGLRFGFLLYIPVKIF